MTALFTRLILIAFIALGAPAFAQDDPVVAKVNGTDIRQSDLAAAEEDIGQNLPPMQADAKRDYLITYVMDMLILAKAAEDKKLGDGA
ncbi:MAG TPA: peptidylprolyl isomerase, partial [Pseudorhodoplanes sp.]|nr:peptidylprolyl isomerase [Pseudorhodoplanes sp.]